jgi:hypothetical protein
VQGTVLDAVVRGARVRWLVDGLGCWGPYRDALALPRAMRSEPDAFALRFASLSRVCAELQFDARCRPSPEAPDGRHKVWAVVGNAKQL